MPYLSDVEKEVRKLRKKLRQIENLERREFEGKELNEEEENKVLTKAELRTNLKAYLLRYEDELQNQSASQDITSSTLSDISFDSSTPENMAMEETFDEEALITDDEDSEIEEPSDPPPAAPSAATVASVNESEPLPLQETDEDDWHIVGHKKGAQTPTDAKATPPVQKSQEKESPKKKVEKRISEAPKTKTSTEPLKKQKKIDHTTKPKVLSPNEKLKQEWLRRDMTVLLLEGHNDLVTAVHLDKDWLVSGSRDTMVKVWDTRNGLEEKSFGGHTDTITAVYILPLGATQDLCEFFELPDSDRLVLSASQDCSIKLWSLSSGTQCLSMYTYNPVTSLGFLKVPGFVVTGTGGGKVELWDLKSKSCIQTSLSHDGSVNEIRTVASMVYSAGADGIIKVYQLRDTLLHVLHGSDDVTCQSGSPLLLRPIRSMAVSGDLIYYGDDGSNVKVLDWKKGQVHKLKNHAGEFGSTDAMSCQDDVIMTSGYDLDEGIGYINLWSLEEEAYLCTLRDESFTRFMSLSTATNSSHRLLLATGGLELRLWLPTLNKSSDDFIIRGEHLAEFSRRPVDSDLESEGEMSESEPESTSYFWSSRKQQRPSLADEQEESRGWGSWCSLL